MIRELIIKGMSKALDFTYEREESAQVNTLLERLVQSAKDINEARGKVAIYYREIVSLNRTVARKSYQLKKMHAKLDALKMQYPELFEAPSKKERLSSI